MQRGVGHEVLWVIRDCLTGEPLLARSMLSGTKADLAALLREVKDALPLAAQRMGRREAWTLRQQRRELDPERLEQADWQNSHGTSTMEMADTSTVAGARACLLRLFSHSQLPAALTSGDSTPRCGCLGSGRHVLWFPDVSQVFAAWYD